MSVLPETVTPPSKSVSRWIGFFVVFLVLATIARDLVPMLLRDNLYAGDAAQHTWWLYKFADPSLFPNDLIARFMSMSIYSPPGYQLIFRLTAGVFDPQHLCESIAIVLALLSAYLSYRIARRVGGWPGVVFALVTYSLLSLPALCEGGFPRSFGLSILLAAMLAMLDRRWWLVGLLCLISSVIYPPILLNVAPVSLIVFFIDLVRGRLKKKEDEPGETRPALPLFPTVLGIVLGLLAVLVIAKNYLQPLPDEIGTFYTVAEARHMPEWNRDGRNGFFRGLQSFYYSGPTSGIGLTREQLIITLVLLVLTVARNPRMIRLEAWVLVVFSLFMWGMAHLFLFKLYLPSRYTMYAFPTFAIFWAAGLGQQVCHDLYHRLATRCFVPACIVVALVTLPYSVNAIRVGIDRYGQQNLWNEPPEYESALAKIRELPKDTLIAAHPRDANAIPLRTQHSVLVNSEVSIAYHRNYYADMQRRLFATFSIFYATDWRVVDALADQYNVKVFLVNRNRLRNVDTDLYYEPFRTTNQPLIEQGKKTGFVMLSVPKDRIVFQSGDVMLVKVGTGK